MREFRIWGTAAAIGNRRAGRAGAIFRVVGAQLLLVQLLSGAAAAQEAVDPCDLLAADRRDYMRVSAAVADRDLRLEAAEEACRKALERKPNDPRFLFQLARVLIVAGKKVAGIGYLQESATAGYPAAQFLYGDANVSGVLSSEEYFKAYHWYLAAAKQGHPDAQLSVSVLLNPATRPASGRSAAEFRRIPANRKAAIDWLRKAVKNGQLDAAYLLGSMLIVGRQVPKNRAKGMKLIAEAARKGHAQAQYAHATDRIDRALKMKNPERKEQSVLTGLVWLQRSAEQGLADGQIMLGQLYFEGKLVRNDPILARYWYCKAGTLGGRVFKHVNKQDLKC